MKSKLNYWFYCRVSLLIAALLPAVGYTHNVDLDDIQRIAGLSGPQIGLYAYLGAKHMVTGYDHILFLLGVIFYLERLKTVILFVSLFALGHTITLISGVLSDTNISPYLVDAVIGFSVAYKGFDNLGGFDKLFGERPNEKVAVFGFGLFHGLGLATKLQHVGLSEDGLLPNLLAFNVGVEVGQIAALVAMVMILKLVPAARKNVTIATSVNCGLILAGIALMTYQIGLYVMIG
jgi:hypothetical protein